MQIGYDGFNKGSKSVKCCYKNDKYKCGIYIYIYRWEWWSTNKSTQNNRRYMNGMADKVLY